MFCIVAGDGDNQARSPGRARRKPIKPLRREGRIDPVNLWWLTCVFSIFTRKAAGALDTRLSLRPLLRGGLCDDPDVTRRGKAGLCHGVHPSPARRAAL